MKSEYFRQQTKRERRNEGRFYIVIVDEIWIKRIITDTSLCTITKLNFISFCSLGLPAAQRLKLRKEVREIT